MGIRKSYTLSAVNAPNGSNIKNFDDVVVFVAAGGTVYLDSAGSIPSELFTLNTTWQTLTADVDNGGGDITLTNKIIKGIANTEYVVKVNTAVVGNMDVATSTITVKAYNSSDALLETRTITLPTLNGTNRDDYVNLSTLMGASYIVIGGQMDEATGDYDATITVTLEAMDEIPYGVTFSAGAEAGNAILLTMQLLASDGSELAGRGLIDFYLSDDAFGNTASTTAEGVTIGTDGVIIGSDATTNYYTILSESDGDIDVSISETTGADTYYAVVILPDGKKIVSDAIVFAA